MAAADDAGRQLRLQDVLVELKEAQLSARTTKRLQFLALQLFAARGPQVDGGAAPVGGEPVIVLYEQVMTAAAQAMGGKVGSGRLRRLLLESGNRPLALRVEALSRARRVAAHPDLRLPHDVASALVSGMDGAKCESSADGVLENVTYSEGDGENATYSEGGVKNETYSKGDVENVTYSDGGGENGTYRTYSEGGVENVTYREGGAKNETYSEGGVDNATYSEGGAENETYSDGGVVYVTYSEGGLANLTYSEGGVVNATYSEGGAENKTYSEGGVDNVTYSDGGVENVTYCEGGAENEAYSEGGVENATYVEGGAENETYSEGGVDNVTYSECCMKDTVVSIAMRDIARFSGQWIRGDRSTDSVRISVEQRGHPLEECVAAGGLLCLAEGLE